MCALLTCILQDRCKSIHLAHPHTELHSDNDAPHSHYSLNCSHHQHNQESTHTCKTKYSIKSNQKTKLRPYLLFNIWRHHFFAVSDVAGRKHLLWSSGGDEAGRLILAGAPSWGAHILHFFAHLPYTETSIYKSMNCYPTQSKNHPAKNKKTRKSYSNLFLQHDVFNLFYLK